MQAVSPLLLHGILTWAGGLMSRGLGLSSRIIQWWTEKNAQCESDDVEMGFI